MHRSLRDTFFTGRAPPIFYTRLPRFVCAVHSGQDSGFNALPGALNGGGGLKGFIWCGGWKRLDVDFRFSFLNLLAIPFLSIELNENPLFTFSVIFIFKIDQAGRLDT